MNTKTRVLAAGAAIALFAGTALTTVAQVSAQEPGATPRAEREARRGRFLERVAEQLSITSDELRAAIKAAALDAVDEALANGRITEEQAAKARERIEDGKGLRGLFERRQARRHAARVAVVRKSIIESAADALSMPAEDLKDELKSGKSIAAVASDQGVDVESVKSQILGDAETKLDEAVANGKLKQERADAALAKLTERIDDILNKSRPPAAE